MTVELSDKEVELILSKLDLNAPYNIHTPTYERQMAPLDKARSEKLVSKLKKIRQEKK